MDGLMANNTEVYWEANGHSLHTYGWSLRTFGGSRNAPPPKRGEDLQVPFRRGLRSVRKMRDATVKDLEMWILPLDEDGKPVGNRSLDQMMHRNWRMIRDWMDVEGQFPLVKRWWDETTVRSATAWAELVEAPEPTVTGGKRLTVTFRVLLADPYFYETHPATAIGGVTIDGDAPTDHLTVVFTGGTNPRVTTPDGNWVQYQGSPGSPVTVDVLTGMATQGGNYVNGLIVRNPDFPDWPTPEPGDTLTLTGGGSATLAYDAAWK